MKTTQTGFTLLELMVVVLIIGILVAIALPNFASSRERARVASVKTNARNVQTMVESYGIDHNGVYPVDVAALQLEAQNGDYWKTFSNPYDPADLALVDFSGVFPVSGAVGYEVQTPQRLQYWIYGSDLYRQRIKVNGAEFVLSNG
jgi:prepilin-type N-terminal cleavage/methylation domain-containing protein